MDTLFIGQKLISLETVGSTNDYASKLISEGPQIDGTVVWAKDQNKGRGQRGNVWRSTPFQNLTFSIILHPNFIAPATQFSLSQAVSLGIRDYLASIAPMDVQVKWPNDILVQDRKIAGILLENTIKGNVIDTLVVGIGLNVNQSEFDGLPNASSLRLETGVTYLVEEVMRGICKSIEVRYMQLRRGEFEQIDRDYHKHLFLKDTWHQFKYNGRVTQARILRAETSGRLILQQADGPEISCELKELDFNL